MKEKFDKLKALGCDVDGALERFLGDEQLYLTCVEDLKTDASFDKLGEALAQRDSRGAFQSAHKLKGVYANMGMIPIYNDCVKLVEPLRSGEVTDDMSQTFERMQQFMNSLRQI